jgi:hypothetical protein
MFPVNASLDRQVQTEMQKSGEKEDEDSRAVPLFRISVRESAGTYNNGLEGLNW